ncbi:MAG: DUF2709 domain-containing protein [Chlamydiota bacterium]
MADIVMSDKTKKILEKYFKAHRKHELVSTYLYYLEKQYDIQPVAFPREKRIYQSLDQLLSSLEERGELWRETEIKIRYGKSDVNEDTSKIYICPFTGKVFGNNTHPNPQDAIYDWVSKCPENTERQDGVKVKRFYVSEDPEIIQNYIKPDAKTVAKTVFSSVISGKIFNTKQAVIDDFINNYVKRMNLVDVQSQNRFEIEEYFMSFLGKHLTEERVAAFVEKLSEYEEFAPYVNEWIEEGEE